MVIQKSLLFFRKSSSIVHFYNRNDIMHLILSQTQIAYRYLEYLKVHNRGNTD
jgi:hypothetical protein